MVLTHPVLQFEVFASFFFSPIIGDFVADLLLCDGKGLSSASFLCCLQEAEDAQ